jgi:diguanylate cyclase (GGDEF)-like protein
MKMKKKKNKQKHGLSKRIVSMTVLFDAFFLILVMAVLAFVYVDNLSTSRENNAVLQADNAAESIQTFLDRAKSDATHLSEDEDVINYLRFIKDGGAPILSNESDPNYPVYARFFATIKAIWESSSSLYNFIFVATETTCAGSGGGCYIGVNEAISGSDWNIAERSWYTQAIASTDPLTVSVPYIDDLTDQYVITVVIQVMDGTEAIGYLGIDVLLETFGTILSTDTANPTETTLIYQLDLESVPTILYYSDSAYAQYAMTSGAAIAALDEQNGYGANGFSTVIADYKSGEIIEKSIFGQSNYIIYPALIDAPWRVAVLIDRSNTVSVEITFLILVALVIILMTLVSLVLGKRIKVTLSPINDILDSIEEIKKGNFDISVQVNENNELKDVADAINIMSKEIGSQMDLVYKSFLFDTLTGLKNRRACHQEIEEKILSGTEKSAICLIDVDNLKNINVTKGQSIGDELLTEFAQQLSLSLNSSEYVYANGGNEFIFFLPKVKQLETVEKELLRVFEKFKEPITIKNLKVEVKCNIGVAIYPYDGKKMDDLIKKCDTALFKAKQSGNGKYVFYNDQITREVNYMAQINEQLAEAIEKEQMYLKYQPLIDNKNEIYGFEALARWNSPTLGEIGPQVFIANAEESHLIIPIGTWILKQACLAQVNMAKRLGKQFVMSVNVSPVQILQKDFIDILKKVILETDIDPHFLVLEITEGVLIDSTIYLEETINFIHEVGAKIALDDFGTGYASLTYLRKLPFDNLKIDKSFVDGIFSSKKDHSIIGTIVQLVHNLNMIVIAEGIETRKQYEFLKQITTDVFQGFLFSKALDYEETLKYVDQFYKVNKTKRIDVFANKDYTE